MLPYGAFVLSSISGDDANAMVVTWVTQVSFVPRRIALGLQKSSYTYGLVQRERVFVINLFGKAEPDALRPFLQGRERNPGKMKEVTYSPAPQTGCPVLANSAAYVECRVLQIIDVGGDHDMIVGEPVGAGIVNKPRKAGSKDILTLMDINMSYGG